MKTKLSIEGRSAHHLRSMSWMSFVFLLAVLVALMFLFYVANEKAAAEGNDEGDSDSLVVVSEGQAHAVIVIHDDADERTQQTADILVEYVQKSTGVELPAKTVSQLTEEDATKTQIYIGQEFNDDPDISTWLETMDLHGFVIHPDGNQLTIIGPTVWGTRNGVYDFLERYVGVRWLLPGEDWEDVPQLSELVIPGEDVIEEPDFTFRELSPTYENPEEPGERQILGVWAQRNKLQGFYNEPIQRYHNLNNILPPAKYNQSNPEFYPNGSTASSWQPCFTEEGTIDAAISEIVAFFNENPEQSSISLAVNDNSNYCEANPNHPAYPGKLNSMGLVDMSDIYYNWVNEVAEGVLEVYPDKWFGALAYNNVNDPPSFELNPRVVPFLTKDRLTWIDEEMKTEGHQQMDDWQAVANQLGWYDYLYGIYFATPRVYPHVIAENLQYAKNNSVIGFMPDTFSNAGDGPKAWITAQLEWDTEQDVDLLLEEWYERAVGPEAAPYLAEYYDLWEDFWTVRIKDSTYFNLWKRFTYMEITDPSYLQLVTDEDIAESKRLMELVVQEAQTEQQKERARQLYHMFEYYDASLTSFPRESDPPEDEETALEILENLDENVYLAQKRLDLIDEFDDFPALKFPLKRNTTWSGWDVFGFWNLVQYMYEHEADGGAVKEETEEISEGKPSKQRDVSRLLMEANQGLVTTLTGNPSFEDGGEEAAVWTEWIKTTGSMRRVEGTASTGNASLLVENLARGGPHQTFAINPGLIASQVKFYTPPDTNSDGIIEIQMTVKDATGRNIKVFRSNVAKLSDTAGEWASIGALDDIPAIIDNRVPTQVQIVININNAEGTQVYLDDAVAYQVEDRNLVPNPGFEFGSTTPSGWHIQSVAVWDWVQDEVNSGQYAFTLLPGSTHSTISTKAGIPYTPGKTYRVSFWAKNSSTNGGSLGIRRADADNKTIDYTWFEVERDSDWSRYSFVFDPAEDTYTLGVYLQLEAGSNGQIWFDDIYMGEIDVEVEPDSAELVIGDELQLEAVVRDEISSHDILWSLESGEDVINLTGQGVVTALAEGEATVRATSADTGVYSESLISVRANEAPTVTDVTYVGKANTVFSGVVVGSDPEGEALTYSIGTAPTNGMATVEMDGSWTYVPNEDYKGADAFTVEVSDVSGGDATATVNLIVTPGPETTATIDPAEPNGGHEWYTSDVTVNLDTTVEFFEADRTEYRINGGGWNVYSDPVVITEEGVHELEYRGVDTAGIVGDAQTTAIRIDKTAPTIEVVLDKTILEKPNHKMAEIQATVTTEDDGSGVASFELTAITSNEADNATGDGNTDEDIQDAEFGTPDTTFCLRAERSGMGDGRVYTITYTVTDEAGLTSTATVQVLVPKAM